VEKKMALYRQYDYISWEQGDLIQERLRELTYELGESSLNIIESFAAPDRFIASCIAHSDGQLYGNLIRALEEYPHCYADNHWFPMI
jgi:hypothetical protein